MPWFELFEWDRYFGHRESVCVKGRELTDEMFVKLRPECTPGKNAKFSPEIAQWCSQNLKKRYWIHGFWDDSTFMHDFELIPEFTIYFYREEDAALFKLFWL